MKNFKKYKFIDCLSHVIDNRGKTCPTSKTGIPLIATNCIKNDSLYPVFENIRFVNEETYETWFRGHPEAGDMIFVTKGSPGRVCWVPKPVNFCIAQDMLAIRANEDIVVPKFLFALLRSEKVQHDIENLHVGSLIPHFKKGDFDQLFLNIPTDKILQRKIGDIYFSFCNKIELNRRMNQTLEHMAQALFNHYFVDNIDTDNLQDGWERGWLKDYIKTTTGYSYKSSELTSSTSALVTLKNFDRNGGFRLDGFKEYEGGFKKSQIVQEGDLAVAHTDVTQNAELIGNPILIINPYKYDRLVISTDLVKIDIIDERMTMEYLYYVMRDSEFKNHCLGYTNGTTVLHLSKAAVGNYKLNIPRNILY